MIVYREAPTLASELGVGLHTLYALSNRLCAHYHTVELTSRTAASGASPCRMRP